LAAISAISDVLFGDFYAISANYSAKGAAILAMGLSPPTLLKSHHLLVASHQSDTKQNAQLSETCGESSESGKILLLMLLRIGGFCLICNDLKVYR